MEACEHCGEETDYPWNCNYCNLNHCSNCRMPEQHACTGLATVDGTGHDIQISNNVTERSGPEPMDPADVGFRPPPNRTQRVTDTVSSADLSEETWDPAPEPDREWLRTDQLRDRITISFRLFSKRLWWNLIRLVQFAGLATIGAGAFLYFRRSWMADELHGVGPSLAELPQMWLIQDWKGNVALMIIGMAVAWLSLK